MKFPVELPHLTHRGRKSARLGGVKFVASGIPGQSAHNFIPPVSQPVTVLHAENLRDFKDVLSIVCQRGGYIVTALSTDFPYPNSHDIHTSSNT
jgi:hypothetical protein